MSSCELIDETKELIKYKFMLDNYLNFLLSNISENESITSVKNLFTMSSCSLLKYKDFHTISTSDKSKINFFITNDFKNTTLSELMGDTAKLEDLITTYKNIQDLIEFFRKSNKNGILISNELKVLLNNYIFNKKIEEDEEYENLNLHSYKNLTNADIQYLYNKYCISQEPKESPQKQPQEKPDDWKYNNILIYSVVAVSSFLSGCVIYGLTV